MQEEVMKSTEERHSNRGGERTRNVAVLLLCSLAACGTLSYLLHHSREAADHLRFVVSQKENEIVRTDKELQRIKRILDDKTRTLSRVELQLETAERAASKLQSKNEGLERLSDDLNSEKERIEAQVVELKEAVDLGRQQLHEQSSETEKMKSMVLGIRHEITRNLANVTFFRPRIVNESTASNPVWEYRELVSAHNRLVREYDDLIDSVRRVVSSVRTMTLLLGG